MPSDIATRLKNKQYEQSIIDYLNNRGHLICITDDAQFTTLLRTTVMKQLGQNADVLTATSDPDQALRIIRQVSGHKTMPLVFLERMIGGTDMGFTVRQLKNAFPDLRIVMLTSEAERQRLVLLHEIGADNFITKPISINGLIEKIASTIKPQGKLGQLLERARTLVAQGNPQQALKVCKQLLEIKADSAAAFLVVGDAFRALGKLERARDAYEEASRNAEMFLEPLRRLADLHEQMGDSAKRLHYLERLDQLSPLNVERKVDMGEIQLALGNEEPAGQLFENAVTLATKEALRYIGEVASRVAALYAEKNPQEAEKFLRRALEAKGAYLSKEDIGTFNRLGILLRNQGKWKEALVEYQKALKVAPDDENLYYNMGMACAEGKEFREAQVYMLKALAINPDLPRTATNIAYNIALVFGQNGDKKRAADCLNIALECDPEFEPARRALERM